MFTFFTQGAQCEECAHGYTRATPGSTDPRTECVLCQCNGHGIDTGCDAVSGACTCQHNTQGVNCESCADGYYGDALAGTPGK